MSCTLEEGDRITPEDKDNVKAILRKPLPVSTLTSFSRLYSHRGCGPASTDSEVKPTRSNPHERNRLSSICVDAALWVLQFLIRKPKSLSYAHLSRNASPVYDSRNCFSLYHLKIVNPHYYLTVTV